MDPHEKTILNVPNVNSRESTKDKHREVEHIIDALGDWQGTDPATGFQLVKRPDGKVLRIADLVDDDTAKRDKGILAVRAVCPVFANRLKALPYVIFYTSRFSRLMKRAGVAIGAIRMPELGDCFAMQ